ncbi:hypothetical protein EPN83_03435 [Patescibacteria group bacterium]|nr:MAG: hypothetical protein EPN83_03435 [Patescibacteria group bacterium]
MLPKSRRIPRKLFATISFEGAPLRTPLFNLRYSRGRRSPSRAAVVVSVRVARRAAERNRIRRRLTAALESYLPQLQPGFFLVFYPTAEARRAKFSLIRQAVGGALAHIGAFPLSQ